MAEGQLAKQSTSATISFTLPISCQICLGKVRQPVVCPNQHVFCTVCMDIWLQNNKQCPTCRIPITPDSPCRPVLGGTHHDQSEASKSNLSTPSIRKARFDVLYEDYENEIQRLESQIGVLQKQNKGLTKRLEVSGLGGGGSGDASTQLSKSKEGSSSPRTKCEKKECELDTLMSVTEKLQDATRMYESIKNDMDHLKEKNAKLELEKDNLQRENSKLRQEYSSRSPYKYGRYTVAAQQTKLEQYEREIKQLKRALKTSDDYIDELEAELDKLRKSGGHPQSKSDNAKRETKNDDQERNLSTSSGVSSLAAENSHQNISVPSSSHQQQQYDHYNHWSDRRKLPDLRKLTNSTGSENDPKDSYTEQSSLNLELPTPMTPASFLSRLSLDKSNDKSMNHQTASTPLENADLMRESLDASNNKSSSRRRLNFDEGTKYRGLESSGFWDSCQSANTKFEASSKIPNDSFQLDQPNDTTSVVDDLDLTQTREFEDCARLMAEAARRVEQRRLDGSESDQSNTRYTDTLGSDVVQQDQFAQSTMSGTLSMSHLQNSVPFPSRAESTSAINQFQNLVSFPSRAESTPAINQLQNSVPYPSRPESTPGHSFSKQYLSSSSMDHMLNIQRPKSAPGLGEMRPFQSSTCNSITFDTVTSNIWKPLGGSYPNIARYNQPKNGASTSSNSTDHSHFMPSPVGQLWPSNYSNRPHPGNMGDTAAGQGYHQLPYSSQSSAHAASNYNRAYGSVGYPKPIGHMSQLRAAGNSVLPQPLRAMHHLPPDSQLMTQNAYTDLVDSRKRKPDMFIPQTFSHLQEQTGCYSPAKTQKL